MILRTYQSEAIAAVYGHFRTTSTNPVVVIPTGGGKTPIMASICRDAVKKWNSRVLVLAHVKELLQQTADELRALDPSLPVGIYSAGLKSRDLGYSITIAGIQSIYKRAGELGPINLIIVDEAHLIPESEDGMYTSFLADAKIVNPKVRILGLTATPYRLKSGIIATPEGILNEICYEARITELIRDGFLCKLVNKAAVAKVETGRLHIRAGEFASEEVESLVNQDSNVEAAVKEILSYAAERKSVLVFCASVAHIEHVVRVFGDLGHECGMVSGETDLFNRSNTLERFKAGELKFLANMNVLTTGFNARNIDCIVMLRPTMSPGLYYQMVGRGFRIHHGKENCLVLDFAGNIMRHGPVDMIRPGRASTGTGNAPMKECPQCHEIVHASYTFCPSCDYEFPKKEDADKHDRQAQDGEIISGEIKDEEHAVEEVYWTKHTKRKDPSAPPTLRLDYKISLTESISEWVCIEHPDQSFPRRKAIQWWKERSRAPVPDSVDQALSMMDAGAIAQPSHIIARTIGGEKWPRIVGGKLKDIPELDDEYIEVMDVQITRHPIEHAICPRCGERAEMGEIKDDLGRPALFCVCGRWLKWTDKIEAAPNRWLSADEQIPF
jgi:DNA repair protein RadD